MLLTHAVTKSKAAFLMTTERMFRCSNQVYFWTFTWPKCMPDHRYQFSWHSFITDLNNFFGQTVVGVRVWEVHEGNLSHGLHCHALINRRLNIHIIKRLCKKHGLGICWVKKADEGAMFYLAKYLTKENQLSKGMRQWGTIGGMPSVKVNNIQVESHLTKNIKWIQEKIEIRKASYAFFLFISQNTRRYGLIKDWPIQKLHCVTKMNSEAKKVRDITPDDTGIYPETKAQQVYYKLRVVKYRSEYGWTEALVHDKPIEEPF